MSESNDFPEAPDSSRFETDLVEDILARLLENDPLDRTEAEWVEAIEGQCVAHPDLAESIRRRFSVLLKTGLLKSSCLNRDSIPNKLGDYRLIRELGGGGMGVVYLAEQKGLDRRVAIKLIRPDQVLFPRVRRRFDREIQAIARLQHPGIVAVHSIGEENGLPYFAMDYVKGATIASILVEFRDKDPSKLSSIDLKNAISRIANHEKPSSDSESGARQGSWSQSCARIIAQVCDALQHAHEAGVLHRDIKPSNILLTPSERAFLFDFGLAQTSGTNRLTHTGVTVGSLPYMSPEQYRSGELDPRTDVYALGVTLYEMLTLESPFLGTDADTTRQLILDGQFEPIRRLNNDCPPDLASICSKAMDRDPERRYDSSSAFGEDLRNFLEHKPILAQKISPWTRASRYIGRHPVAFAGAVVVLLQIALIQLWLLRSVSDERNEAITTLHEAEMAKQSAEMARGNAEEALENSLQLMENARVQMLIIEANRLYPVSPARLDSMSSWLKDADSILIRREAIEREIGASESPDHSQLLRQLDELESLRERIQDRKSAVDKTQWETVGSAEAQEAWRNAIDDIFISEEYDYLEIEPIYGLLPLRKDPNSRLWEFVHWLSGDVPEVGIDPDTGEERYLLTETTALIFVLVPSGEFNMGARLPEVGESDGYLGLDSSAMIIEGPVHRVGLNAFFISKYEMTTGQWELWGENYKSPSTAWIWNAEEKPERRPVDTICYLDALHWLGRLDLELPSESQWEYACRGLTKTRYSSGTSLRDLEGTANIADAAYTTLTAILGWMPQVEKRFNDGYSRSSTIGVFKPNPFGLFDMHGNMAEMCADAFTEYSEVDPMPGTGLRAKAFEDSWIVARGGSWAHPAKFTRSSSRLPIAATMRQPWLGVRPVINLSSE